MAEKTKIKKTNKKGSYDNKIIKIIVACLAVFVAVVIGIAVMITLTTGYVAKVDGMKIYDYEYDYFLQVAQYEIYDEKFEGYVFGLTQKKDVKVEELKLGKEILSYKSSITAKINIILSYNVI